MGTAVAQGVAWLIKWFILRPLFYILIQVLWPFIYGLGVNFLAVYETGWNSGEWLTRGLLIFITLGFLGLLVGIFAPQEGAPGKSASCPLCDCQCAVIRAGPLYHRPVVWVGPVHYDDDYNLRRR